MKHNQRGISHLLLPLLIILVAAIAGTFYMVSSKADQVTRQSSSPQAQARNNLALDDYKQGGGGFVEPTDTTPTQLSPLNNSNTASAASTKPRIVAWNYTSYFGKMRKDNQGYYHGSQYYLFSATTSGKVNRVSVKMASSGVYFKDPFANGDIAHASLKLNLTYRGNNLWGYNKTLSGPTNATSYWFEQLAVGKKGDKESRHSFIMTAYGENGQKASYKGKFKPSKLTIKGETK